jgi:hypothetical protein
MEKTRIYSFTADQLSKLEKAKDGGVIIPEGFELYIVPSEEEARRRKIAELEKELAKMKPPSDKELIEYGKMISPYHMVLLEIETLRGK